mmetsp:Transcript_18044/g.30763  ORF Transcript_18044/g.30763 Transcript_18044/m.30763 type:complete len:309 (-) Transcript_18044:106-1032(-)
MFQTNSHFPSIQCQKRSSSRAFNILLQVLVVSAFSPVVFTLGSVDLPVYATCEAQATPCVQDAPVTVELVANHTTYYCEDVRKVDFGELIVEIPYRRRFAGARKLKYGDFTLVNDFSEDDRTIVRFRPVGTQFLQGYWADIHSVSGSDSHELGQTGSIAWEYILDATLHPQGVIDVWADFVPRYSLSAVGMYLRWYETYDHLDSNHISDKHSITFMSHPGGGVTLSSPTAQCAGFDYNFNIQATFETVLSVTARVTTYRTCQATYSVCGDPFQVTTKFGTSEAITCEVQLANDSINGFRFFEVLVNYS